MQDEQTKAEVSQKALVRTAFGYAKPCRRSARNAPQAHKKKRPRVIQGRLILGVYVIIKIARSSYPIAETL